MSVTAAADVPEPDVRCPLCWGTSLEPCLTMLDHVNVPAQIFRCNSCLSHVPASAFLPDDPSMAPEIQVDVNDHAWNESTAAELDQLRADLRRMVAMLEPEFGPPGAGGEVIEIGCGRGGLLRALLDHGYDATGCEPSRKLVAIARRHYELPPERLLAVTAAELLDALDARRAQPQAFVLWHVIEHLRDALPLLQRCVRMMGPGGRLLFQVPMVSPPCIFPGHYFFLTPESLPALSRHLGGMPYRYAIDPANQFLSVYFGWSFAGAPASVG